MRFTTFAAAVAVALALAPAAQASTFGSNLIANGNAETGNTAGWATTPGFEVVNYGAAGGFPSLADPGPAARGTYFFGGGYSAKTSASQTIDLSALSAAINTGASRFDLSAWLGGYDSQNDNAELTATFFGSGGATLSQASIGPVSNTDRGNQIGLLLRDTQGYIPVGTLNVGITLTMIRNAGSYNDGYADNLSFAVAAAPVPEADAYAMLLAGLAVLGVVAKRKQRKGQA
ncbi:PEP-CTERM sorting domain-containing protein [Duganella sp. S19_KUP01_CR8]|uniref:PEP-CTERM sorting domain-containing protein n=1 Tax=Duganella sp. S19_KUP01_CR8 TaxID=3025502 RepID=UPI002FCDB625